MVLSARKPKTVVKGPIRCHKCQLLCSDAKHYLTHTCTPRSERL